VARVNRRLSWIEEPMVRTSNPGCHLVLSEGRRQEVVAFSEQALLPVRQRAALHQVTGARLQAHVAPAAEDVAIGDLVLSAQLLVAGIPDA